MYVNKSYEYGDVKAQNQDIQDDLNLLRQDGRHLKELMDDVEEFLTSIVMAPNDLKKKKNPLDRIKKRDQGRTIQDIMHL